MAQVLKILKVLGPHFVRNSVQETGSFSRTSHFSSESDEYSKLPLPPISFTSLLPPYWLSGSMSREWVPDLMSLHKIKTTAHTSLSTQSVVSRWSVGGCRRENLDSSSKFRFVFRYEAVVFRRYVLVLLSVGLLRKFEAYPVYPSLIRSKNLRRFSFFQKFRHFTYMLLWFHLVIPSFPARIDDMRSRFSAVSGKFI